MTHKAMSGKEWARSITSKVAMENYIAQLLNGEKVKIKRIVDTADLAYQATIYLVKAIKSEELYLNVEGEYQDDMDRRYGSFSAVIDVEMINNDLQESLNEAMCIAIAEIARRSHHYPCGVDL